MAMVIGVLQFELHIHDASSLKDKRRVVQSLKDRLHREHLVAVAEVAAQDKLNAAVLGVAAVASEGRRVAEVLDAVEAKLRSLLDAEVAHTSRSIIHGEQLGEAPTLDDVARDDLRREMLDLMQQDPGEDSP
jgi:uncharacterized protein YlxP (DUF503 family)